MSSTDQKIEKMSEAISTMGKSIDSLAVAMIKGFERVDVRLTSLETKVGSLETKVDSIDSRLYSVEKDVSEIRKTLADVEGHLQGVSDMASGHEDRIMKLELQTA